jgi:hypothetical protein
MSITVAVQARSFIECAGEALFANKAKNMVSLALDAAGFIPGAGLAHTVVQLGVGITGTVNSAIHEDLAGSFMGIAGIHLTALEPLAKSIPVLGTGLNAVGTVKDIGETVRDYLQCKSVN